MSTSVTNKKQNFFKAVSSEKDRQDLIESLVKSQCPLQLKQEGQKGGSQELTVVKSATRHDVGVIGVHQSGPELQPSEVTVAFELAKAMFFCTGDLVKVQGAKYVVKFNKIFELQRRDAYRVTIPQGVIAAKVVVATVNKHPMNKEYRVSDLSAGGVGLAATEATASLLPNAAEVVGSLQVGAHSSLEFSAVVKYHRKITTEKQPTIHIGCEFQNMTVGLSQKLAFLVNDCHRITFSRLSK